MYNSTFDIKESKFLDNQVHNETVKDIVLLEITLTELLLFSKPIFSNNHNSKKQFQQYFSINNIGLI